MDEYWDDYSVVIDGAVLRGCDAIGIMGNCGMDCPYFLRMDCSSLSEIVEDFVKDKGGVLYIFSEEEL